MPTSPSEIIATIHERSAPGPGACRTWIGGQTHGYGAIRINGRSVAAHAALYRATYGATEKGIVIRHSCDNPLCVAISHLLPGTQADNVRDMVERGRLRVGPRRRGEEHHNSRLMEEDVRAIRSDPRGCQRLAKAYDVSLATIKRIRNRKVWSWLTD